MHSLFKLYQYLKIYWPITRVLQLMVGLLLLAEGIFGEFKIVVLPALWILYLSVWRKGCASNHC